MRISNFLILFLSLAFLFSCYGGLEPVAKSYIKGTVTFINDLEDWPPRDSVKEIRVVAFKSYPPQDILGEVISGNAYYSEDTVATYVKSAGYEIEIVDVPAEIKYIVAAQRYGNIMEWRAIGVFTFSGDKTKPTSVYIDSGQIVDSIAFEVDFKNLPPQPF